MSNPLSALTDLQLFDTQVTLALACGRARSSLKKRHREQVCFLAQVLKNEADDRGRPSPTPPYRA